jgi:hypothetical protein
MSNEIDDFFSDLNKNQHDTFSFESILKQILWDAQVDDAEFPNAMTELVTLMRNLLTNEQMQKELQEIDLSEYQDEEEE